jgi:hypothetical protein
MSKAYDKLLNEVCVGLGFCGSIVDDQPLHVDQFLPTNGLVTAEAFADALFKAEGWSPEDPEAHKFRRAICEAFTRHMGAVEVDAPLLR